MFLSFFPHSNVTRNLSANNPPQEVWKHQHFGQTIGFPLASVLASAIFTRVFPVVVLPCSRVFIFGNAIYRYEEQVNLQSRVCPECVCGGRIRVNVLYYVEHFIFCPTTIDLTKRTYLVHHTLLRVERGAHAFKLFALCLTLNHCVSREFANGGRPRRWRNPV